MKGDTRLRGEEYVDTDLEVQFSKTWNLCLGHA